MLDELARVQPPARRGRLVPTTTLLEAGIDPLGFLDVVTRIEGRYQMRFREEWLAGTFDPQSQGGEVAPKSRN